MIFFLKMFMYVLVCECLFLYIKLNNATENMWRKGFNHKMKVERTRTVTRC